ncbi:MAG: hypothetical protein HQL45_11695 [Alphaproteobacteria bacterium]|nr:hypothetical protein [Alphaproteobacteria bacterium]
MPDTFDSVRYVKNGAGGRWWPSAKENSQIHVGWSNVPEKLLATPIDFPAIQQVLRGFRQQMGRNQNVATNQFKQLKTLLDKPSQHIWVTFEEGCMWWCTVHDQVTMNPLGEEIERGYFWLTCATPWAKQSPGGRVFDQASLPGIVSAVAGFKGTVCTPGGSNEILRLLRDQKDMNASQSAEARAVYEAAVGRMIEKLTWQDFEQLIDLILARTSWTRISQLGGTQEGVDIEVENFAVGEIAFVQIKGVSSQAVFNDYVARFSQRRDRYARMIFAVHTTQGNITPPNDLPVQIWERDTLAQLAVRLGLGQWIESKLA